MTIYKDLRHGFLNMVMPGGINVTRICLNDTIEFLNRIFNNEINSEFIDFD